MNELPRRLNSFLKSPGCQGGAATRRVSSGRLLLRFLRGAPARSMTKIRRRVIANES